MNVPSVITIDGAAASGKSTLGQLLARRLGYLYFDTGVMYRALTALALQRGVSIEDEERLQALAEQVCLEIIPPTEDDGRQYTVLADGEDITWQIRSPQVERHVSVVSRYPSVRSVLQAQQRRIGSQGQIVMVGRDIGAVVMPDAGLKIFLEASLEERARRRMLELMGRGHQASYEEVLADLQRRDALDRQNTYLPEDAHILRTDAASPEELVDRIVGWFEESQAEKVR